MHKNIFIIILLSALFFSCSESVEYEKKSDIRTKQEAIEIAQSAYTDCFLKNSRGLLKIEVESVDVIKSKSNRSSNETPLLYIVNFTDSLGFAIVSASENTIPLLGISDCGTYNEYDIDKNSNFEYFMNYVYDYAENADIVIIPPVIRIPTECAPKLEVLWGQNSPYGDDFRNGIAGCSNIATAMIMSYFKQPQTMSIHDGEYNYNLYLDWKEICKHKKTGTYCNENNAVSVHNQISKFIRQIGRDNYSNDYGSTGTSTDFDYVLNSLIANGYTCSPFANFSDFSYKTYLNSNYLVYVSGVTNTNLGHDWIMDGYKTMVQLQNNGLPVIHNYCHYNWGAEGRYNGYFLDGIFDITNAYQYDGEIGPRSYNFNCGVVCSAITY